MDMRYQTYPVRGELARNMNLLTSQLIQRIQGEADSDLYCYIVDTVEEEGGLLKQGGSGPNFQGGMISLCTCKHLMRTARNEEHWKNVWVAGFTSSKIRGRHYLYYLMKVSFVFASQYDLWTSNDIPFETKEAKLASQDRFGDVYKPIGKGINPYDPESYEIPCEDHVHCDPAVGHEAGSWHEDICYTKGHSRRQPYLLFGDPKNSFLWTKPGMMDPGIKLGRGHKIEKLRKIQEKD
jgi:hypothetical protein